MLRRSKRDCTLSCSVLFRLYGSDKPLTSTPPYKQIKKALKRKKLVKDVVSYKAPELNSSSKKRLELLEKINMI